MPTVPSVLPGSHSVKSSGMPYTRTHARTRYNGWNSETKSQNEPFLPTLFLPSVRSLSETRNAANIIPGPWSGRQGVYKC